MLPLLYATPLLMPCCAHYAFVDMSLAASARCYFALCAMLMAVLMREERAVEAMRVCHAREASPLRGYDKAR